MSPEAKQHETATLIFRKETYTVRAGITIYEAIASCDLEPEILIPTRAGELVKDEEILQPGETIKIYPAISGG